MCGWAGATGHVDSLSLLSCRKGNCHPCHSGLWTQRGECMYVSVCVLSGDCDSVGWEEKGERSFISQKQLNAWTLTLSLPRMTKARWEFHNLNLEEQSPEGEKTLDQMTQWWSEGREVLPFFFPTHILQGEHASSNVHQPSHWISLMNTNRNNYF